MMLGHEAEIQQIVEHAVAKVYNEVFLNNVLTAAESKLAWWLVIEKLVQSAVIDHTSEALKEQFTSDLHRH